MGCPWVYPLIRPDVQTGQRSFKFFKNASASSGQTVTSGSGTLTSPACRFSCSSHSARTLSGTVTSPDFTFRITQTSCSSVYRLICTPFAQSSSARESPCFPLVNIWNAQGTPFSLHARTYISLFSTGTVSSVAVAHKKQGGVCSVTCFSRDIYSSSSAEAPSPSNATKEPLCAPSPEVMTG